MTGLLSSTTHCVEAFLQCKPACHMAVLLHSAACNGSATRVEHSPVALICVAAVCAEQPSQTELHLLHAATLKLISKQQLPAGCAAVSISPNSCCIASIHQLAHPDLDNTPVEQQDLQHHPTESAGLQSNPVLLPQGATTADVSADDTSKTPTGTLPKELANDDTTCSTGVKAGQKRKREEAPHTTIVCFQSLPAEALTAHLTATKTGSSLQASSGRMLADDAAAVSEVDTVKAENGTMPASDKAQMKAEVPTEQSVALQVNIHCNLSVFSALKLFAIATNCS